MEVKNYRVEFNICQRFVIFFLLCDLSIIVSIPLWIIYTHTHIHYKQVLCELIQNISAFNHSSPHNGYIFDFSKDIIL